MSAIALAATTHPTQANITFDLRAFDITEGVGAVFDDGKSVALDETGNVTLQIWAQVTNAAPVNNIFGVQQILGAIVSSNAVGITGSVDPLVFPAVFNSVSVVGISSEMSLPPDAITDRGLANTVTTIGYPKARKDPAAGGESLPSSPTFFYATNNQPAGATVNPIAGGFEFLMGTTTLRITDALDGGTATLNWKIPDFTTPALRAQIAQWTDGDGLPNSGSAQFAEMSVGAAVNFFTGLGESLWASIGGGSWTENANWNPHVPSALSKAVFGGSIVGPTIVTLDGNQKISAITFESAIPYTIAPGTVGTLTVSRKIDNLAGSHSIAVPVTINTASTSVNVASMSDTLTISGAISGTGGLQKSGPGNLRLAGANTYGGTTMVTDGTLELNTTGANAIAGNVNITGGTLRLLQNEQIADTRNVTIQGGTLDLGSNSETVAGVQLNGGAIVGSGTLISTSDYVVQGGLVSATLAGNVGLTKTGTGTVVLTNATTFTGVTTVGGGTLEVHVSGRTAIAGGVAVSAGMLNMNVTNATAIAGDVNVSGGAFHLDVTGGIGIAGNVSVSGGTLEANVNGANAIAGNVSVSGGTLRLLQSNRISDTSSLQVTGGTFQLGTNSETVAGVRLGGGSITGSGTLTSLSDFDLRSGTISANLTGNVAVAKTTAGSVTLSGTNSYQGATTITAGTLVISSASALPSGKPVSLAGGSLNLQAIPNQTLGTLTGAGAVALASSGVLTVGADAGTGIFGGMISGTGASLIKTGAGDQTLSGNSTYTGSTTVLAGRLIITGQSASSAFIAESGGTLRLDSPSLNIAAGSVRPNLGGVIEYGNTVLTGGFLRGVGTHLILPASTMSLNGVTSFGSTTIVQNGRANLTNVFNGGEITNGAPLTWDGGVNTSSGRLIVNNASSVRDWTNDGVVTVNTGGVLSSAGSDLVSGGGSRITVQSGGQLNVEMGFALDLQGSLLVNDGTINGATEVHYGATAKGGGAFGSVSIFDGGTFSLGDNSGAATINGTYLWGADGNFDFAILNARGVAGSSDGWDSVNVIGPAGLLEIDAGIAPNSRFTIHIASHHDLSALNFDSGASYDWLLVDTEQGITGFDPAEIAIDASQFVESLNGGSFSVVENGNQLYVSFRPVPEPSCTALLLGTLAILGPLSRRRRA